MFKFLDKPHGKVTYARLWKVKPDEEDSSDPIGIAIFDRSVRFWINVDGKWVGGRQAHSPIAPYVLLYRGITKAEYETDKAFGLFPELTVTYRPIRAFIHKRQFPIWGGSILAYGLGARAAGLDVMLISITGVAFVVVMTLCLHFLVKQYEKS